MDLDVRVTYAVHEIGRFLAAVEQIGFETVERLDRAGYAAFLCGLRRKPVRFRCPFHQFFFIGQRKRLRPAYRPLCIVAPHEQVRVHFLHQQEEFVHIPNTIFADGCIVTEHIAFFRESPAKSQLDSFFVRVIGNPEALFFPAGFLHEVPERDFQRVKAQPCRAVYGLIGIV
ncbi:MAG: hypothetical protein DELT_03207 [Desulfovibrio sp.]